MKFIYGSYGHIAQKDLFSAISMLEAGSYDAAVVQAQQSVEKILKEYLQLNHSVTGIETLIKTHKPWRIVEALNIKVLYSYESEIRALGDAYFDTRYPGIDYMEYNQESAKRLVNASQKIFDIVKTLIEDKQNNILNGSINRMEL